MAETSTQITTSDDADIINGITNWLYEEEIFQTEKVFIKIKMVFFFITL